MSKNKDLGSKLERLAQAVVDQALGPDVKLDDRLEALKVAGGFHISATKIKLKLSEDDDLSPTFGKFKDLIHSATNGTNKGAAGHG